MARPAAAFVFPNLSLSLPEVKSPGVPTPRLDHPTLAGRLTELSGGGVTAVLTLAFTIVREIQHRGEPVAWVLSGEQLFYPPDVCDSGVDCEAMVVVCVPAARSIARAAELGALGSLWAGRPRSRGARPDSSPYASALAARRPAA